MGKLSYEQRVNRARKIIATVLFAAVGVALVLSWNWIFYDVIQFPRWSIEAKVAAFCAFLALMALCWWWDRRIIARRSSGADG